MKRWLPIAATAILTLVGLVSFNSPVMAREYHPRHVFRAEHVRAAHARAAHFRALRHGAHR
jgi:hypothetical protein